MVSCRSPFASSCVRLANASLLMGTAGSCLRMTPTAFTVSGERTVATLTCFSLALNGLCFRSPRIHGACKNDRVLPGLGRLSEKSQKILRAPFRDIKDRGPTVVRALDNPTRFPSISQELVDPSFLFTCHFTRFRRDHLPVSLAIINLKTLNARSRRSLDCMKTAHQKLFLARRSCWRCGTKSNPNKKQRSRCKKEEKPHGPAESSPFS